jgi:hypothetical protein
MLDWAKICEERCLSERDPESGRSLRKSDPRGEKVGALIFVGIPLLVAITLVIFGPVISHYFLKDLGKGLGEMLFRLAETQSHL